VGFELNQAYCEIIQQRLAMPETPVKKKAGRKKPVVPAQAGTQVGRAAETQANLGSRLRGNDGVEANTITTEGTTP
jgi:hypothetical protein